MTPPAVREDSPERRVARFTDPDGTEREVLAVRATGRATVVFERPVGRGEPSLVGIVAADEPPGNAELLGVLFAADAAKRRIRCPPLGAGAGEESGSQASGGEDPSRPIVANGVTFTLRELGGETSLPELRWARDGRAPVSVRDVVGAIQAYAPVRAATETALARDGVSTAALRVELSRLLESPILLNRRLRERVEREVRGGALSMGEIAFRCSRTKRDSAGTRSGDTSWLARRVGLLPEGGQPRPTPWVHTDVLALIAREGLGVCPCEVETP